ncbi:MAG TPA: hypothetical protein VMR41_00260 [Patescibacteria group bacterium]|nr:hypothetical protein [Patescibacteria group bacterium]
MKLLTALLHLNKKTKQSLLSLEQQKTIEMGRKQFEQLVKRNLAVPVVLL